MDWLKGWRKIPAIALATLVIAAIPVVRSCADDASVSATSAEYPFEFPPTFAGERSKVQELAGLIWPPPLDCYVLGKGGKFTSCPDDPLRSYLRATNYSAWKVGTEMGVVAIKNTGKKLVTKVTIELEREGQFKIESSDGEKSAAFSRSISIGELRPKGAVTVTWWSGPNLPPSLYHDTKVTFAEGTTEVRRFGEEEGAALVWSWAIKVFGAASLIWLGWGLAQFKKAITRKKPEPPT